MIVITTVAVIFALIILTWVSYLWWSTQKISRKDPSDGNTRNINLLLAIGQTLAGLGTFFGLVYAGNQIAESREQAHQDLTFRTAVEFNQRLTEAIEQLGSVDVVVREGALVRLRFLINEARRRRGGPVSLKQAQPIREAEVDEDIKLLLAGYIRAHATTVLHRKALKEGTVWPPSDVIKAVMILSKMNSDFPNQENRINLKGVCLKWAVLKRISMKNWILDGADFTDAWLPHADFANASLHNSIFRRANLTEVNFTDAELNNADISEADAANANLTRTILYGTTALNVKNFPIMEYYFGPKARAGGRDNSPPINKSTKLPDYASTEYILSRKQSYAK